LLITLAPYDDPEWSDSSGSTTASKMAIEGVTVDYPFYPSYYRTNYIFKVDDPNLDKKYSGYIAVDSWTARVVSITKEILAEVLQMILAGERCYDVSKMISPQQAMTLARQYLQDYFPDIAPIVPKGSYITIPSAYA
jgi:hypothetical protein